QESVSSTSAEDQRTAKRCTAQRNIRTGNLVVRATTQLTHRFCNRAHAVDVALREEASMRIHWQRAVQTGAVLDDVLPRLSGWGKTVRLQTFQRHERGGVVQLGDGNVGWSHACVRVQPLDGRRRKPLHKIGPV